MRVFHCDDFPVELPEGHRFPMGKYGRLRTRLVEEGLFAADAIVAARPAAVDDVLAVHEAGYVFALMEGALDRRAVQRIGFPWSEALVLRSLASVGATLAALDEALRRTPDAAGRAPTGFSGALAGGTHHAHRDFGAGYCVFNDLAVAARKALDTGRARRVLVFDVDVHQGDGTAAIFADDPRVFTCSLHGARNFPARKMQSDLDVPLPDGIGDEDYLVALDAALEEALQRAAPDVVLVQAGVDVLAADRLGRFGLTHTGVRERDRRLLRRFRSDGLPVVLTLGGGYSDPIDASVEAYVNTYREATQLAGV